MRFQVYQDAAGEYRWRLVAKNGKTVAESGEGYKRQARCVGAVERFIKAIRTELTSEIDFTPTNDPRRRK